MTAFEVACKKEQPEWVVVVGDVNSTMACAITAKKLCLNVAHIEAGLRSRDRRMPEEINRIVTDAISDLLFTPSEDADMNLLREGVSPEKICRVGNIMIDSVITALPRARTAGVPEQWGVTAGAYGFVTLHRPSNVDNPVMLRRVVECLRIVGVRIPLIFPTHPRTRDALRQLGLDNALHPGTGVRMLEPLSYYDAVAAMVHAQFVLTDSGGVQEETTYLGIPCLTLRETTERPITVIVGTNELVTVETIPQAVDQILAGRWKKGSRPPLWDGMTAERITAVFEQMVTGGQL